MGIDLVVTDIKKLTALPKATVLAYGQTGSGMREQGRSKEVKREVAESFSQRQDFRSHRKADKIAPDTTTLLTLDDDGKIRAEREISSELIQRNDTLKVVPGEKIPTIGMPLPPYLYANDFVQVIKKKHDVGSYREMVIYVEIM
jgi:hypothetical protein